MMHQHSADLHNSRSASKRFRLENGSLTAAKQLHCWAQISRVRTGVLATASAVGSEGGCFEKRPPCRRPLWQKRCRVQVAALRASVQESGGGLGSGQGPPLTMRVPKPQAGPMSLPAASMECSAAMASRLDTIISLRPPVDATLMPSDQVSHELRTPAI